MGFITVGGGPRFFVIFNAADKGAIGEKSYYHAKVGSFRDSLEFCLFVCKICNLWYLIYVYIFDKSKDIVKLLR